MTSPDSPDHDLHDIADPGQPPATTLTTTASWRWSWSGPPRRRRSPRPGSSAAATRTRSTAPRSTPCARCSAPSRCAASIVIGEGENDDTPMLYAGEHVGSGQGPLVDIAIDPIDGAGLTAKSLPNAMSMIALADRGRDVRPGAVRVHGQAGRRTGPGRRRRLRRPDRGHPGHDRQDPRGSASPTSPSRCWTGPGTQDLVGRIRAVGARIKFLIDGDLAGALMAAATGVRGRPAGRDRRHPGGRHRGVRDQEPGRRDLRPAHARNDAETSGRRGAWATTWTGC